jgi:hypothetical protein
MGRILLSAIKTIVYLLMVHAYIHVLFIPSNPKTTNDFKAWYEMCEAFADVDVIGSTEYHNDCAFDLPFLCSRESRR